ncbi:uncharacterized protein LOC121414540 [Lytechinus variegatus]|uniref:uncharacterized protein LOC121414540 n=1 Tax=Lytechinus variegatus TaxID=7654 RepID=UPI001BB19A46|nr:uncharacterized protein LOC121414540 [Lytechinus variegatus]
MSQKWALLDFGDLGIDTVETRHIEFPDARREDLCNEYFDDIGESDDEREVTYYHKGGDKGKAKQGKKGAKKGCTAKILKFGDTKDELKMPLARALDGKNISSLDKESPLGRGKRQHVPNVRFTVSDSDEDDIHEIPLKKEKKEKEKAASNVDVAEAKMLVQQILSTSKKSTITTAQGPTEMEIRVEELEKENASLRAALSIIQELPALLESVRQLTQTLNKKAPTCTQSRSPKALPSTSSSPTCSMQEPKAVPDEDLLTSDGNIVLNKEALCDLKKSSPRALVNAIMSAAFSKQELINHSLTGAKCNLHKEDGRPPLPPGKVAAVKGFVKRVFPEYQLFNKHASEKISNLRKSIKQ